MREGSGLCFFFCGCLGNRGCWRLFLGDFGDGPGLFLRGGANESDVNMAGALEERAGGAFGAGTEAAQSGTSTDDSFLDDQGIGVQRLKNGCSQPQAAC